LKETVMGSLLVHITHGPEAPTRAALGLLVARSAVEAGHDVTVFLAGDAAYLVKDAVIEHTIGVGTGALSDSFPALVDAGVPIFISRSSSGSRGVTEDDLAGKGARFSTPAELVELTFAADRVLCY
jgi:predicted peroxiredoxin